jgi:hypothetical protein
MVLILLELGANGKHTNHNEHTPLMSAAAAEPTVSDKSSTTPNDHNAQAPQTKYNITIRADINIHLHQ